MTNLSTEHLIKCIIEKDKYKQTQQYIKEIQLQNQPVYTFVNQALYSILVANNYPPTSKLYALRFFKDVFLSAQFQLIDGLHENIMKQIIKVCQFDKQNSDRSKRGCNYFEQVQKRKKQSDTQKISYSFVLFCTQIVYVMGVWHTLDQNNEKTDYATIFQKLKKTKIPFPANDKELKFFKPEQKQLFMKNYKQWVEKLPEIQQQSQEGDQKQNMNQKSRKSIKSKQKIPEAKQNLNFTKQKLDQNSLLRSKDQNEGARNQQKNRKNIQQKIQNTNVNKNDDQIKKLRELNDLKEKQIVLMKSNIEELSKQNEEYKNKVSQLEITKLKGQQKLEAQLKNLQQRNKSEFNALEIKYLNLQNKYMILEKDNNHLKLKLQQIESLRQRQQIQSQKQKLFLRKTNSDKSEVEQKLKLIINQTNQELKQAEQKIKRLERQIDQLNTIKISYKKVMEENQPHVPQQKQKINNQQKSIQQQKIQQLQKQGEQIVQFYTKQIIQLKQNIKDLQAEKQELQNNLKTKQNQITSIKSILQQKSKQVTLLQSKINKIQSFQVKLTALSPSSIQKTPQNQKQIWPQQLDINEIMPELKKQKQLKRQNSMSDFLQTQSTQFKKLVLASPKALQQPFDNVILKPNPKNKSLGKTEKSEQKVKQRKNRYSAGKTFHFTSNESNKFQSFYEMNSPKNQLVSKKGQSNSYANIWKAMRTSEPNVQNDLRQSFVKKSSALLLERKSQYQQSQMLKSNCVQTLVPFVDNYFSLNSHMSPQDSFIFKSLCLFPSMRQKQPIFVDKVIQVKLFNNALNQKQVFVLQVMNVSYSSIKVKALSCHDEFKILGQKTRFIHSNNIVEYQIQTRNKDLNLRYPIISLMITQQSQNRTKHSTYNISLPLTLLEFSEMNQQIPQFCKLNSSKLKVLKSQTFTLSPKFQSLKQCFPQLLFMQKNRKVGINSRQHQIIWQGNLLHSFIENVDTYFKMIQIGNQVSLQFVFRDYDKVSQSYCKVMIQTLMFLLQARSS